MLSGPAIIDALQKNGFGPYTGTPCSLLQPLISYTISRESSGFLMAANEGEAVAIACGAWLAGKKPVVMFQNSGLGNAVNPLASLCQPFRIPILIFCSWRGEPGRPDEPQHELMGRLTPRLFADLEIGHAVLPLSHDAFLADLEQAIEAMSEAGLPRAFIVPKGSIEPMDVEFCEPLLTPPTQGTFKRSRETKGASGIRRIDALQYIRQEMPNAFLFATTGKTGRELYEMEDREDQFYMVGSMGCAPSLGLGAALARPDCRFAVIDGDGALLMRMESLVSIGQYHPANLTHILLDNERHDSTGGQPTLSPGVDFCAIAAAAGYQFATECRTAQEFVAALQQAQTTNGPHFVHLKTVAGSKKGLGRPGIQPHEVARRFRAALTQEQAQGQTPA
jgi:phosphonopyruvate decarboxylase